MAIRSFRQRGWNTLLHRYSTELVKLAEHSRSEAMLALAKQEAATAQHAYAAMARAEDANRAKDEFLSHISHELRTPLNAIIGFSEFMAGGALGPAGSPKYLEYARDINKSGRHLLDMISGILDMSKIEAGQYDLTPEDIDVVSVAEFCLRLIAGRAAAGDIVLACEFEPGLPKVHADERALRQILLNLLSNAVKFTPAGGRVVIGARAEGADRIALTVTDTGVGIGAADLEQLGEPFRQVGRPPDRPQEGAGLGLAITKRLVAMQDGTLTIETAPGRGCAVTVMLPMARTAERRAVAS